MIEEKGTDAVSIRKLLAVTASEAYGHTPLESAESTTTVPACQSKGQRQLGARWRWPESGPQTPFAELHAELVV